MTKAKQTKLNKANNRKLIILIKDSQNMMKSADSLQAFDYQRYAQPTKNHSLNKKGA